MADEMLSELDSSDEDIAKVEARMIELLGIDLLDMEDEASWSWVFTDG